MNISGHDDGGVRNSTESEWNGVNFSDQRCSAPLRQCLTSRRQAAAATQLSFSARECHVRPNPHP